MEEEAIDDQYDDTQQGDIGITTSFGDATVALTLDTRSDETDTDADTGVTTDDAQYSYSFGYTVAGVALSLTGTDADDNGNAATNHAEYVAAGIKFTF